MTNVDDLRKGINKLETDLSFTMGEIRKLNDRINSMVGASTSPTYSASTATVHGDLSGLTLDDHPNYVHITNARTITAQHSFAPTSTQAPFILGANAQGQLVTGLNADKLDGLEASAFEILAAQNANKIHAGPTSGGDANPTYRYMVENDLAAHNIVGAAHTVAGSTDQLVGLTATSTLGLLTPSSSPGAAKAILKTTAAGLLTLEDMDITDTLDVGGALGVTGAATFLNDLIVNTNTLFVDQSQSNVGVGKLPTAGYGLDVNSTFRTGGLATLASLSVTGAASFGDDLTVGANIFFVDYSGQRVGIKRAPDPQFQLDILGNLRASGYIVGKHAIQLENVTALFHFDGAEPYETDFTGVTTGHKGQTPITENNLIFREGKFGSKAVQIARATTNLVLNPSFEDGLNNWTNWGTPTTREVVTTESLYGTSSLHLVTTGTLGQGVSAVISVTSSQNYTLSAYAKADTGRPTISVVGGTVDMNTVFDASWTGDGEWHRLDINFTADSSSVTIYLGRRSGFGSIGEYWFDAAQLEQSTAVTPYCDGSLGNGHSWSGTAHASSSSRAASLLRYQPDLINATRGTIMAWVKMPGDAADSDHNYVLYASFTVGDMLVIANNAVSGPEIRFRIGSGDSYNSTIDDGEWHHVAVTWDNTNAYLYLDGVLDITHSSYTGVTGPTTSFYVGTFSTGVQHTDGLIDDLVILSQPLSADEIIAVYESNAPVFAETSTFEWHTPSVTTWVDEEGLWSRGISGQEVFGISDVNSKSWAGLTLNEGDVVIGNSPNYLLWDDSNSSLIVTGKLIATKGHLVGGSIFSESFDDVSSFDDWELLQGPNELSIVSGGTFGGSVLEIGNNSGNDTIRLAHKVNIPYDPSKTYKMTVRARRTAGTGPMYAGFLGIAADGSTYVSTLGTPVYTNTHWFCANNVSPTVWTVYEGWVTGTGATGDLGTPGDPTDPGTMHQDVKYVRPIILGNGGSVAGTYQFDAVIVEVTPQGNDLTSIDGGRIVANTVDTNQLVADAIDGMTITGATIRTSASGSRVQMDSTGIFGTDGSTVQWQALNADGLLTAGGGDITLSENGVDIVNNSNHVRFIVAGSPGTSGYIANDTILGRMRNRATNVPASPINYTIIEALTATGIGGSPSYPGRLALVGENLVVVSSDVGAANPTANGTLQAGDMVSNGSLGTTWTGVSFGTNWQNFGGPHQVCEYKKFGDLVFVRGLATSTTNPWATYTTLLTLPLGYRPLSRVMVDAACNGDKICRLHLETTGVLAFQASDSGTGSGWINLNNIVFSID